jgi:hypothetical protein
MITVADRKVICLRYAATLPSDGSNQTCVDVTVQNKILCYLKCKEKKKEDEKSEQELT